MWSDRQISGHFNQHASLTWPVERVARPIVVVSLIKGQPDVCGTFRGLLEHQARHVAPQLEGSAHRQPHRAQRQVARPVHYLVGQVTFVPLLDWRTHTHTHRGRGRNRDLRHAGLKLTILFITNLEPVQMQISSDHCKNPDSDPVSKSIQPFHL